MKKKLLAGMLSFILAVQPAAICQAEEFFSEEQAAQVYEEPGSSEEEEGVEETPESDFAGLPETTENSGEIPSEIPEIPESSEENEIPQENEGQEDNEIPSEVPAEIPSDIQPSDSQDEEKEERENGFQLDSPEEELDEDQEGFEGENDQEEFVAEEEGFSDGLNTFEASGEKKTYSVASGISAVLEDGVLTVTGKGKMPDYSNESGSPWYTERRQITKIVISEGITRIGKENFVECNASELELPKGLKTIGEAAFYDCERLESLDFPASLEEIERGAFAQCYAVKEIDLKNGIKKIGDYAFQQVSVESIYIPASVTYIDCLAVFKDYSLTEYNVDGGNSAYASADGVLYSKDMKTLYCYPLGKTAESYAIPNGVTTIYDNAFLNCSAIKQITIPGTVTKIGDWAFNSTGLEALNIPDSVTSVGSGITENCYYLTSAVIGNGVPEISYKMFEDCSKLSQLTIGKGVKRIDNRAFWCCTSLTEVILPEGLEEIGVAAFQSCTGLTYMKVPSSIRRIESGAFSGCSNLDLDYPSNLTQMEDGSYREVMSFYYSGKYHYEEAYQVLELVNKERAKEGKSKLSMDEDLLKCAMYRAAETCLDFSHTRPNSLDCFSVTKKALGENIAAGNTTAESVMNNWMNSPNHRANILKSDYTSIGIGCFEQGGAWFWVQIFGTNKTEKFEKPADRKVKVKINAVADNYKDFTSLVWEDDGTANMQAGKSRMLKVKIINPGWSYVLSYPNAESFQWSSSDPAVATVDGTGKVTAKTAGKAKITATSGSLSISVNVVVRGTKVTPTPTPKPVQTVKSIKLNKTSLSLVKGKKTTLKATVKPAGSKVKWTSSRTSVATVNQNGKITAKKKGTTTITAAANGKKATCKVTVKEIPAKKLKLNIKDLKAYKGYKFTVKKTVTPSNSTDTITWKSSNSKVVSVSSKGVLTMKKTGKATITATTTSGKKAQVKVTVWSKKKVSKK